MATFNKFYSFVEAVAEKVHNLGTNNLKVALTSSGNPPVATNTQLSDLTEISYTDCSSRTVTTFSSAQTSGTYKLTLSDLTLTASATGTIPSFQYITLYNDSATNDELIGYYDNGSGIVLASGQSFFIDFDGANGVLTL